MAITLYTTYNIKFILTANEPYIVTECNKLLFYKITSLQLLHLIAELGTSNKLLNTVNQGAIVHDVFRDFTLRFLRRTTEILQRYEGNRAFRSGYPVAGPKLDYFSR